MRFSAVSFLFQTTIPFVIQLSVMENEMLFDQLSFSRAI